MRRRDGVARRRDASQTKPMLRPREEQVERAGERRRRRRRRTPALDATVVGVAAEEAAEQRSRVGASSLPSSARSDRDGHVVGGASDHGRSFASGDDSGASAARMRGGTGAGRCVARSTQTCTKRPVAAGASSPCRKSRSRRPPTTCRASRRAGRRRSSRETAAACGSGTSSRRRGRSPAPSRMSRPPARIRCSFTAVSKYE